jgi:hypothetical protein
MLCIRTQDDAEMLRQLLESFNDDGEKYGGERVLKILQEERGVDVLTVCCLVGRSRPLALDFKLKTHSVRRRYDRCKLLAFLTGCSAYPQQPSRFQHIGLTAKTSLTALLKLLSLKELREKLEILDSDIAGMRDTLNPPDSPLRGIGDDEVTQPVVEKGKYDDVDDITKLERLVKAREKTRSNLEDKVGWIGMEQARAEEMAAKAAAEAS